MSQQEANASCPAQWDVKPAEFPILSWKKGEGVNSLAKLYGYVLVQCAANRDWYLKKKKWKKWSGFLLRLNAMIFGTLGGVIPVISPIMKDDYQIIISPGWSSVSIALTALLIGIDKFGDMSSGWVRYMLTAQKLNLIEESFKLDWEEQKRQWDDDGPTPEQIEAGLNKLKNTIMEINEVVQEETIAWAAEFLNSLREMEKAAKITAQQKALGGLNVEVSNGNDCKDGWKVKIDGGREISGNGKTASVTGLSPGIKVVKISGKIDEKFATDEKAVKINPGRIEIQRFELQ